MFIQINQESVYGANFSMRGTFFIYYVYFSLSFGIAIPVLANT